MRGIETCEVRVNGGISPNYTMRALVGHSYAMCLPSLASVIY
jgi:hypothetical protein